MGKTKRSLSREWIAQELAHTFQLPLLSVPVQLGANTFLQLARHQKAKSSRPRQLPPHLWTAVREEACHYCLQTLAQLMGITEGPEAVSSEQAELYDAFLKAVRHYMETPPPNLTEHASEVSLGEQLKYEHLLWRQAREAMELCERWRQALLQHKVPEDAPIGAFGQYLRPEGETQPQAQPQKERAPLRREYARRKQRALRVRTPQVNP